MTKIAVRTHRRGMPWSYTGSNEGVKLRSRPLDDRPRAALAWLARQPARQEAPMATGGFKVMDSDIHVDEPHDLWDRYLEPRFRDRAPRFAAIDGSHTNGWQFEGKVFPAFFDRPERRRLGRIRREKARAR